MPTPMARALARVGLALVLAGAVCLTACGQSPSQVAAQQRDACFQNEAQILTAINLVHADSGVYPDVANVVKQLGVKCPAGGTYSFDANTDTVSCSVHGHPAQQQGAIP